MIIGNICLSEVPKYFFGTDTGQAIPAIAGIQYKIFLDAGTISV
jgi:hypothetical protein